MSLARKPAAYKPTDELYLWLVTQPAQPGADRRAASW